MTTSDPSDPPAKAAFPWAFVLRLAVVLLILAPAFLIARDRYDIGVLSAVIHAPVLTIAIVADWLLPSDWIAWAIESADEHRVGWALGMGLVSIVLWFKILAFLSKSR